LKKHKNDKKQNITTVVTKKGYIWNTKVDIGDKIEEVESEIRNYQAQIVKLESEMENDCLTLTVLTQKVTKLQKELK
jgi:hypothetical protein